VEERKEEDNSSNCHDGTHSFEATTSGKRCIVCKLDVQQQANSTRGRRSKKQKVSTKGVRKQVHRCTICGVLAHAAPLLVPSQRRQIHSLFPENMTCMEIVHSNLGQEIWSVLDNNVDDRETKKRCLARVRTAHKGKGIARKNSRRKE